MTVYTIRTRIKNPTDKVEVTQDFGTVVETHSDEIAIKAAVQFIENLHETISDLRSTALVTDQYDRVKVSIEYGCFAVATEDGFGHVHVTNFRDGGLKVADLQVDLTDGTVLFDWVRRPSLFHTFS